MNSEPRDLESVVRSLSERLERVEQELAALKSSAPSHAAAELPTLPQARDRTVDLDTAMVETPPPLPPPLPSIPPPLPPIAPELPAIERGSKREQLRSLASPRTDEPPAPPTAPRATKPREAKPTLEMLVGGRGLAALGAIILVVGFGLFLKYAYDQGWLKVSPFLRCISGAGFGLALVGVGEWARRKYGAIAGSGTTAAGLGILYTSAFAAYKLFALVGPGAAFLLLGATAMFGVVVGARARLIFVAALSLIGGYITPFLFAGVESAPWSLPAYLLMLLAIGLTLSAVYRSVFTAMRTLVWWGTILIGGMWTLDNIWGTSPHPGAAVAFLGIAWLAIHAELMISALRGSLLKPAPEPIFDPPALVQLRRWRPLVSSFSTSAWFVGLSIQAHYLAADWVIPLCVGCATLLLSHFLAGMLSPVFSPPRTDRERLAAALIVQTAGLLVLTLAIALSGLGQVLAWVVLGVSGVCAGRWLRARPFEVYGLFSLLLASVRLVAFDSWATGLTTSVGTFAGLHLSEWMLAVELCAGAWIGMALLVRGRGEMVLWRRVGDCAVGVGVILGGVGLLHADMQPWAVAIISAGVLAALTAAARFLRSSILLFMSLFPAAVGAASVLVTPWWRTPGREVLGLRLGVQSSAPFVLGASLLVSRLFARLVSEHREVEGKKPHSMIVYAILGTLFVCIAFIHTDAAPLAMTTALSLIAGAWIAHARKLPAAHGEKLAVGTLVFATFVWVGFTLIDRSPFVQSCFFPAIPIVAGFFTGGALLAKLDAAKRANTGGGAVTTMSIGTILFFVSSSFEIARVASSIAEDPAVRGSAVSIYWGVFAVAVIALGFAKRIAWVRYAGLVLIGVASVKAVVFDLGSVPQVWRIASFIGLGVLMLAVHFAYSRLSARLLGEESHAANPPEER